MYYLSVITTLSLSPYVFWKMRKSISNKWMNRILYFLTFYLFLSYMILIVYTLVYMGFCASRDLPLHLCSLLRIMIFISVFSNNQFCYEFSLLGGMVASFVFFLLYTSVPVAHLGMPYFIYSYAIDHVIMFIIPVIMTVWLGNRPRVFSHRNVMSFFLPFEFFTYYVNCILGGNYLLLMSKVPKVVYLADSSFFWILVVNLIFYTGLIFINRISRSIGSRSTND